MQTRGLEKGSSHWLIGFRIKGQQSDRWAGKQFHYSLPRTVKSYAGRKIVET